MASLSKILRGEAEPEQGLVAMVLTQLTQFFEFLFKDENFVVGLAEIKNRNEGDNE